MLVGKGVDGDEVSVSPGTGTDEGDVPLEEGALTGVRR